MRDIKFRAWVNTYSHWHLTNSISIGSDGVFFHAGQSNLTNSDWKLNQYTGLKDKNGKEIYEGDIVRVHEGDDWTWTQEVKFFSGGFWLHDETCLGAVHEFCEVIGNVYENTDLVNTR